MHKSTTTPHLTAALRAHFCRTGVPDKIWSDQGPQFSSLLFREFAKQWRFQHITSSPRYPQSNGKAEATVKSMKKLIRTAWSGRSLNEDKLTRSLLQYRNTPSRWDGVSPAQKLFGHPIQDTLPAHRRAFSAEWQRQSTEVEQQTLETTEAMKIAYNQHARPLPDLTVGTMVAVQNPDTKYWDIYGVITDIGHHRRYFVKTQSGRVLVRNRRFLRKRTPLSTIPLEMPPLAEGQQETTQDHHDGRTNPTTAQHQPPLRRSMRSRKTTSRLIETYRLQQYEWIRYPYKTHKPHAFSPLPIVLSKHFNHPHPYIEIATAISDYFCITKMVYCLV